MTDLKQRIIARIDSEGPLPFDTYQAMCLYDPEAGFFSAASDVRSSYGGDFVTSPEVTRHFGAAIGRFVKSEIPGAGVRPQVVEIGAGSGSLTDAMRSEIPDVDFYAVESSAAARQQLRDLLGNDRVAENISALPDATHRLTVANELIDNIPVALVVRADGGWVEQRVGWSGSEFGFVHVAPRPEVLDWAERHTASVPVGSQVEVQLGAGRWLREVIGWSRTGAALIIDYGGTTEELLTRRTSGTLRTYRGHHLGPHPFEEPGKSDITVDVDFSALLDEATRLGATAELLRQDDFLSNFGLREVVSDLRGRELTLAREGDVMGQMRVRSERVDVETVLHPRGLGDFRVLIVRWQGTSIPPSAS
jgi:SAM-dependent MidA family methyltransferase